MTSPIPAAIHSNLTVIQQGRELLAQLGAERYGRRIAVCYDASLGGHMRHIIEHYQAFLRGLDEGAIDYEHRARDPLVETDPAYASSLLEAIAQRLHDSLATLTDRALRCCAETTPDTAAATSVLRELEFLLGHTIHHYALVAVMARLQGIEPEATFGVAPSTLKFQQGQASCAR